MSLAGRDDSEHAIHATARLAGALLIVGVEYALDRSHAPPGARPVLVQILVCFTKAGSFAPRDNADGEGEAPRERALGREGQLRSDSREREEIRRAGDWRSAAPTRAAASPTITMAFDPASYTATALLLLTVCVMACYVPARRAMRVDPLVALRQD